MAALLLVLLAALVSVAALQRGLDAWRLQSGSTSQKLAFYMAEAGVAEARDDLASGGSGNVASRELPAVFGSGAFWVETVEDEHGVAFITSTGLYDGAAFRIGQALRRPPLPLASEGFFGRFGVVLGDGTVVRVAGAPVPGEVGGEPVDPNEQENGQGVVEDLLDGLAPPGLPGSKQIGGNLSGGKNPLVALPVPPCVTAEDVRLVGSDAAIDLGANVVVAGAALPGPDASVLYASGTSVAGSALPERDPRGLPAIAMPLVESTGDLLCLPALENELESGTHALGTVTIGPLATLTLVGPAAVHVESLRLAVGAVLEVDASLGPVHLYVASSLTVSAGARLGTTSGESSDLVILVGARGDVDQDGDGSGDSPVVWWSSEPVCAALYAPDSRVALPDGIRWRGSVAAQTLSVGRNALLELDTGLLEVDIPSRDKQLMGWRVLEIPADEKAELRADPVAQARALGLTPPCPCAARVPATNEYRFETHDGRTLVYRGVDLVDLTLATVETVLPPVVDATVVPLFGDYSKDIEDEVDDVVSDEFQNAWDYALGHLPPSDLAYLETGEFPPGLWTAVVDLGQRVQPYAAVFNDPNVADELLDELDTSWLPDTSKVFVKNVILNGP